MSFGSRTRKINKKIVLMMNLSLRTVGYYFEILRDELGCRSSRDLIAFYGKQLKFY